MDEVTTKKTQISYDRLADEYVRRIYEELQHKPLDRQLLDQFSARVKGNGLVCDLGCGPGHVARYLREQGAQVFGIDLSSELVQRARRLNSGIEFQQGNMFALDAPEAAWAGIVAFYSIIHMPRTDHMAVFSEMRRVLQPGGFLLLAFHVGDEMVHFDNLWDQTVSIDFHFFRSDEVADSLRSAGFTVEEIVERDPYAEIEAQTRRGYILERRNGAAYRQVAGSE